jgi:TetR/AcrR family transcriptional repressor of nem operon
MDDAQPTVGEARSEANTASRILDIAERLVQSHGFNGFSLVDVGARLGISETTLQRYFPDKADLGLAIIERYATRFIGALAHIDTQGGEAPAKLAAYAGIYADVVKGRRMCLCGILAADYDTLPEPMREAVVDFFDANEAWLIGVLEQGEEEGSLRVSGSARDTAQTIIGGLEGAMLVTRPYGDVGRFQAAAMRLMTGLAGADRVPSSRFRPGPGPTR